VIQRYGNWGVVTKWTPNGGAGSGDRAIFNSGSSTLSFNIGVAGLISLAAHWL